MQWYRYYGRWLSVAFWHAWSRYEFACAVAGLLTPLVQKLNPTWDQSTMTELGWQMTACGFGTLFLVRLILAPWWIHKEQEGKIADAQKQVAEVRNELADKDAARLKEQSDSEKKALAHARLNKLKQDLTLFMGKRKESFPAAGGVNQLAGMQSRHVQETKGLLEKWLRETREIATEVSLVNFLPQVSELESIKSDHAEADRFAQRLHESVTTILGKLA